ncbi:class I SAM-dependent methyltransferase [Yinghuangia seranimata]|uniref:class I SAM-dependent methyltransferase n=1 Tax=Yinghuangia seranimata TaxID=408067 RepID=UPI00248CD8A0|nr:class I SAM-dependent methyltransferase [Yinghuangia seranimata]MDI2124635.1 class I SAM-dependent methyltransferase [Yinghuangia seranimata]
MTHIDQEKLERFVGQAVGDMAAAISGLLVHVGDRLGLYQAMAGAGPLTAEELARRTGTTARYVREWLCNQAAGGYVVHDPEHDTFELPAEHGAVLAHEDSPVFLGGAYEAIASCYSDHAMLIEAFRTGSGVGWERHDHRLFSGVRRLFHPSYTNFLTSAWIPALDGVEAKLKAGASVADIGCGLGSSTVIMAEAYPHSTFAGFDYHGPSLEAARGAAAEASVQHRVRFETAAADAFPGTGFDLICLFDCLHDMGDPVGAARHVRQALAHDGTLMLVEPNAGNTLQDNLNPVGRTFYGFSTTVCTPASLAQPVGLGLGAQAGPSRLTQVLTEAGFSRVRVAAETPFSLVLEARP